MNHYKARELIKNGKPSGIFHYTCQRREDTFPVGYCAQDCPGHSTAKEAEQHQREYVLDHLQKLDIPADRWPKQKCEIKDCQNQASVQVTHHWDLMIVCADHNTRESIATLVRVGECWSSY